MAAVVELSTRVLKALSSVPEHIKVKLLAWVTDLDERGLVEVRRVPGYHDEPLKGRRKGQRSVRLSRSYRAIYVVQKGREENGHRVDMVRVVELSKHDY
jgi:proteic killer suppression protein